MLRRSALISVSVATIGLSLPIALSFVLLVLPFPTTAGTFFPSPLAAFSAGASLCSTSLGTTFAILSSAGMQQTRTGVVLIGAAMMDEVVGLVRVKIVTTLGAGRISTWPIVRPIVASFGLLLVSLAITPFLLRPAWLSICQYFKPSNLDRESKSSLHATAIKVARYIPHLGFVLSLAVLIIFVTTAFFIDASLLFAAFLSGSVVNYLYDGPSQIRSESVRPTYLHLVPTCSFSHHL